MAKDKNIIKNPIAATLQDPKYKPRVVRPRKGKGSYQRNPKYRKNGGPLSPTVVEQAAEVVADKLAERSPAGLRLPSENFNNGGEVLSTVWDYTKKYGPDVAETVYDSLPIPGGGALKAGAKQGWKHRGKIKETAEDAYDYAEDTVDHGVRWFRDETGEMVNNYGERLEDVARQWDLSQDDVLGFFGYNNGGQASDYRTDRSGGRGGAASRAIRRAWDWWKTASNQDRAAAEEQLQQAAEPIYRNIGGWLDYAWKNEGRNAAAPQKRRREHVRDKDDAPSFSMPGVDLSGALDYIWGTGRTRQGALYRGHGGDIPEIGKTVMAMPTAGPLSGIKMKQSDDMGSSEVSMQFKQDKNGGE